MVVPAWNEAFVIGRTIDTLMSLDYPRERLRVYVVDDASTDETPDVVRAKAAKYPGRVFHLRRAKGGEGKAHTLNHGLRIDPRGGLVRGGAGHRRRRDLHRALAAADGAAPRRSERSAR